MNTRIFFTVLSISWLAACAPMTPRDAAQNPAIQKLASNAKTRSDHNALARHFENAASEMKTKAVEQKELLEHYEEKGYLYGRQAQDLKSHTAAMVRKYEDSAEENIREAALHRQKAAELMKGDVALEGQ
jgi:hypothetical protein